MVSVYNGPEPRGPASGVEAVNGIRTFPVEAAKPAKARSGVTSASHGKRVDMGVDVDVGVDVGEDVTAVAPINVHAAASTRAESGAIAM